MLFHSTESGAILKKNIKIGKNGLEIKLFKR